MWSDNLPHPPLSHYPKSTQFPQVLEYIVFLGNEMIDRLDMSFAVEMNILNLITRQDIGTSTGCKGIMTSMKFKSLAQ
jgi:hypothetical protein